MSVLRLTRLGWLGVMFLAVVIACGGTAHATVKGETYTGALFSEDGLTGTATITFGSDYSMLYIELFEGDPIEQYSGTFTESSRGRATTWTATLYDGSADGLFHGQGYARGNGMIAYFQNPDFAPNWIGIFHRVSGSDNAMDDDEDQAAAAPAVQAESTPSVSGAAGRNRIGRNR
jgi:hypothetical protein